MSQQEMAGELETMRRLAETAAKLERCHCCRCILATGERFFVSETCDGSGPFHKAGEVVTHGPLCDACRQKIERAIRPKRTNRFSTWLRRLFSK